MIRTFMVAGLLFGLASGDILMASQKAAPAVPARKPDLADMLAGVWEGNVISDSKGSSRSDVLLKLERVGPNIVRIVSNYPRLPVITVPVERVTTVIMHKSGNSVFLYDPTRNPPRLDVSFNSEVSWSGQKQ